MYILTCNNKFASGTNNHTNISSLLTMPQKTDEQLNTFAIHASHRVMPKYALVKQHLIDALNAGRLLPSDSLPTEIELAAQFNVARSTVRQALAQMDREGFIRRIRGKGTFVCNNSGQMNPQPRMHPRELGLFALVMPESHTGPYPAIHHGFEQTASEKHSQVIVSSTNNDPVRQGNVVLQLLAKKFPAWP